MKTNRRLLKDKDDRLFLLNSTIEVDEDLDQLQVLSGLAYLSPNLPSFLEVFDLNNRVIGQVHFSNGLRHSIRIPVTQVNTVFNFTYNTDYLEQRRGRK